MRVLACPASLKGALTAGDAAAALAAGLRRVPGVDVEELPVADGGEGTLEALARASGGVWRDADVHDAFGRPRRARWLELEDGTAVVEAAEAIPLDPEQLDPLLASSRGLGELVGAVGRSRPRELVVGLGGTANVDGGAGLREVLDALPAPTRAACDVRSPLVDAARLFAAQKGASPADVTELEARLLALPELVAYRSLPGAGAAGGLGAAFAALGAELVPGAALVLDEIGFEPAGFDLVVTGEGAVDRTTGEGKAVGEVARRCRALGVRCAVFGGRIVEPVEGAETYELSGDPARAATDLEELGERLARRLAG
ncbi:MAG: glycerate kinase [Actinobacteria bacterium]|nr:MAG: glycerate kinase [Actinomycetota bacterium]